MEIELIEYLHIIRKRIWLIAAVTIFAVLVSAVVSVFVMDPVYEAKATLIVGRAPSNEKDKVQYNDVLMYQQLVKTYAELAKSRLVIEETISKSGYDIKPSELQKNLKVTPGANTQIITISIENESAEKTVNLANTLCKVFVEKVKSMMNSEDVKIMDKAELPERPVRPKTMLNIAIAAVLGLMVSIGVVFLMEYLDNTIKTEDDIEKHLGLTVLASIPYVKQ